MIIWKSVGVYNYNRKSNGGYNDNLVICWWL